ncbi:MAG: ABC-2 transporter permease [Oscillospiraceae bacterium]
MYGLLYKELVLNRKSLFVLALVDIYVYAVCFFLFGSLVKEDFVDESSYPMAADIISCVYALLIFIFALIILPQIFSTDESKRWSAFISSSPAQESGQIYSKYMFGAVLLIVSYIWSYFAEIIFDAIISVYYGFENTSVLSTNVSFVMVFVVLFIGAVEFPFYVRFGSKIGSSVKMGIFFGFLFIVVVYFLFGDLSVFGSLDSLWEFLSEVINGEAFGDTAIFVLSLCALSAFGLYILSYRISSRFYLKGAESFEQ